jgi:branched-chain amino acid transport system substrate-binding protein
VSGDGVCSEKLPQLAGDALGDDKVVCVVAGGVTGAAGSGHGRPSRSATSQRYKHPAADLCAVRLRRVMVFAKAAMQTADSIEPARFLPALAHIQYQGVTGAIAFDPNGDLRDAALTLYTYRQGKQTKLQVVR